MLVKGARTVIGLFYLLLGIPIMVRWQLYTETVPKGGWGVLRSMPRPIFVNTNVLTWPTDCLAAVLLVHQTPGLKILVKTLIFLGMLFINPWHWWCWDLYHTEWYIHLSIVTWARVVAILLAGRGYSHIHTYESSLCRVSETPFSYQKSI